MARHPYAARHTENVLVAGLLADYRQCDEWSDIEDDKEYFKQTEERVDNHIEGIPLDGKKFTLCTIYQIRGKHQEQRPQDQEAAIDDGAPYKKVVSV